MTDRRHWCLDCWLDTTPTKEILACPCCRANHRRGHKK